ncbi:hypothetical protein [Actinomadura gamaensis]|uniref:Uncharacterized protein n=1 Tax=Actinomadura gamaensis TaxID=1763541 RepID=A0ABV9UBB3_9ACTN
MQHIDEELALDVETLETGEDADYGSFTTGHGVHELASSYYTYGSYMV